MLRRNMTSAECQISHPKGRYLVFTLLFFQMAMMKTHDLNTKIITKKPKSARNCESWARSICCIPGKKDPWRLRHFPPIVRGSPLRTRAPRLHCERSSHPRPQESFCNLDLT